MLDIWIKHYSKIFPTENIYILWKNNKDFDLFSYVSENINVIEINTEQGKHIPESYFNYFQKEFLKISKVVVFADVDELICHSNLPELLQNFEADYLTTTGFEIVQNLEIEDIFNPNIPILQQRNFGTFSNWYDKPIIIRKELFWHPGKHNQDTQKNFVEGLYLVHLGRIDFEMMIKLNIQNQELYGYPELDNQMLLEHFKKFNPLIEIPEEICKHLQSV